MAFMMCSVTSADICLSVEQCLKMCGLEAYADAVVGSLGVGHRKRTTIGVELAAKVCLIHTHAGNTT